MYPPEKKEQPQPWQPQQAQGEGVEGIDPQGQTGGQAALGPQGQKPQTQGGAGQELQQPAQGPSEDHQEQDAEKQDGQPGAALGKEIHDVASVSKDFICRSR